MGQFIETPRLYALAACLCGFVQKGSDFQPLKDIKKKKEVSGDLLLKNRGKSGQNF